MQGLNGGIVSGDESNAYTLVDIRAANATRKPDAVLITPESFPGYADYLYDDSSSSQYNINIHLKHTTGVFTVKVKSFAPRQIQRRLFAALVTLSRKVF